LGSKEGAAIPPAFGTKFPSGKDEVVFLAAVAIRKHKGVYSLRPLSARADDDPNIIEVIGKVLEAVVQKLNGA
jgi:hypothetical protein